MERVDSEGRVVRDDADVRDTVALTDKDLRDAYDRGRRDEAVRHRRNWLWTIIEALLALVGVIVLVLAALNGSFERGGRVIDEQLWSARVEATPAIQNAASSATNAVRDARDTTVAPANPNTNTQ
ncbi:MAG: hypothetical protein ACM3YN_12910 [Parcubacteria group bacterium]